MILVWLLCLLTSGRTYHTVPLETLSTNKWTHVCVTGPVVYKRKQDDGDWHITLAKGKVKVVLEIIPLIPLTPPEKGDIVTACGITRQDKDHNWPEIHPVEMLSVIKDPQHE